MSDNPRVTRLRAALEQALHPTLLEIRDDSARHAGHAGAREGGHFHVIIAAAAFIGVSPVQRHRMVYAAAAELMGREIHALSIDARTLLSTTQIKCFNLLRDQMKVIRFLVVGVALTLARLQQARRHRKNPPTPQRFRRSATGHGQWQADQQRALRGLRQGHHQGQERQRNLE